MSANSHCYLSRLSIKTLSALLICSVLFTKAYANSHSKHEESGITSSKTDQQTNTKDEIELHEETLTQDIDHPNENAEHAILKDNILAKKEKTKGLDLLEKAKMFREMRDYKVAEKLYLEALNFSMTPSNRKVLLLELGKMYDEIGISSKLALVYEKYLEKYPKDSARPQILIRLGRLYREMGAYDMAIKRFYDVLNSSLKISDKELPLFKHLTLKAQLEIADTYFITKEYDKAIKLFKRLQLLDITDEERQRVDFKLSYAYFYIKDNQEVIRLLNKFLSDYPDSTLSPESHFLLANAYEQMNHADQAIKEAFNLIRHKDIQSSNKGLWYYWAKKTANHLANNFYEQEDYISALKIYQAMVSFASSADWQAPIVYQIGRCFERLQKFDKAKQAYEILISGEEWKDQVITETESLKSFKQSAQWRLENIQWLQKNQNDIQSILQEGKVSPANNAEKT